MPEIRQNIAIEEWVIIATERAKRPEDFIKQKKGENILPEFSETCPFCPGNERLTPPETFSLKDEMGKWLTRCMNNKFPALSCEGEPIYKEDGIKRSITGIGLHKVIVETPKHNMTTALLENEQIINILNTYKYLYLRGLKDKCVELIIIFKNHGESAGTSLEHPHSQMIATPIVPYHIRNRIDMAMHYYDNHLHCVFCRMIRDELKEKERIVFESSYFVAFIPYAALSPFHLWILPKRHMSCYPQIDENEINDLAYILKTVLKKVYMGLDNPDFNYVIRSLPGQIRENKFFHWYISIIPRLSKAAGFEMGSGMFINTALPEVSAEFLRNIKITQQS